MRWKALGVAMVAALLLSSPASAHRPPKTFAYVRVLAQGQDLSSSVARFYVRMSSLRAEPVSTRCVARVTSMWDRTVFTDVSYYSSEHHFTRQVPVRGRLSMRAFGADRSSPQTVRIYHSQPASEQGNPDVYWTPFGVDVKVQHCHPT